MLYCLGNNVKKKKSVCVQYRHNFFPLDIIFYWKLVGSVDMEPMGMEGQLYVELKLSVMN